MHLRFCLLTAALIAVTACEMRPPEPSKEDLIQAVSASYAKHNAVSSPEMQLTLHDLTKKECHLNGKSKVVFFCDVTLDVTNYKGRTKLEDTVYLEKKSGQWQLSI